MKAFLLLFASFLYILALCTADKIVVTSPKEHDVCQRGNYQMIEWTSDLGGGLVKIELIWAQGTKKQLIVNQTEDDGDLVWEVSVLTPARNDYQIQITSSHPAVPPALSAVFSISSGSFYIEAPAQGAQWDLNSDHQIIWETADIPGDVMIELYTPQLTKKISTITPKVQNDGLFIWAPDASKIEDGDYVIKLSSISSVHTAVSAVFTLVPAGGHVAVKYPRAGDVWQQGNQQMIEWSTGQKGGDRIKIELVWGDKPSRQSMVIIKDTEDSDLAFWACPLSVTPRADYQIQVSSSNPAVKPGLSGAFSIIAAGGRVVVKAPRGGDAWHRGAQQTIQWDSGQQHGARVLIELFWGEEKSRQSIVIMKSTEDDGKALWLVPYSLTPRSDYQIQISSYNPAVLPGLSSYFSISSGALSITSPTRGDEWMVGVAHTILWETGDVQQNVKLELFTPNLEKRIVTITNKMDNDGIFYWIPSASDILEGMYVIKLSTVGGSGEEHMAVSQIFKIVQAPEPSLTTRLWFQGMATVYYHYFKTEITCFNAVNATDGTTVVSLLDDWADRNKGQTPDNIPGWKLAQKIVDPSIRQSLAIFDAKLDPACLKAFPVMPTVTSLLNNGAELAQRLNRIPHPSFARLIDACDQAASIWIYGRGYARKAGEKFGEIFAQVADILK